MLLLWLTFFLEGIKSKNVLFGPSIFDRSIDNSISYGSMTGFLDKHEKERDNKGFGSLSLVTYNMEFLNDLALPSMISDLIRLMDSAHPTVMTLQSALSQELKEVKDQTLGHYGLVHTDVVSLDLISGAKTLLPIIYDTYNVDLLKSGVFKTKGEHPTPYATWAFFENKSDKKEKFTIVNLDLFTNFKNISELEMVNISQDIRTAQEIGKNPVFLMGYVNVIPLGFQKLLSKGEYKDTIKNDINNLNTPQNTTKYGQDIQNNTPRDFIFVRDPNSEIVVNYSRVLKRGFSGTHYPLHSIVSFAKKDTNPIKK